MKKRVFKRGQGSLFNFLMLLTISLIFFISSSIARAQVGTTGANFLKYGLGVRPEALGGAFGAISDDVNCLNFNPAGLTQIKDIEISFMYFTGFADVQTNIIKAGFPLSNDKALGMNIYIRDIPEFRNVETEPPVKAMDTYFSLAYAQDLPWLKNLSLGIIARYIYSSLAEIGASTYALDSGLLYSLKQIKMALVMQNLGPAVKFLAAEDPLPLNFKLGIALNNSLNPSLEYIIATDLNFPYQDTLKLHLGLEFILNKMFSARLGYEYGRAGQEWGRITGGAGINFNALGWHWQVNYAYSMFHRLDHLHGLDICVQFPL